MSKVKTSLLALALVGIGAFWIYVRLGEREPEVIRNTLVCPDCGKTLPQKDAPCPWCEAKKTRAQVESDRPDSTKQEPSNAVNVIIVVGVSGGLLVVALWPQIQRLWSSRDEDDDILVFRCPHCDRKLRYQAAKAGMQGKCPTCKRMCTFPGLDQESA